MPDFFIDMQKIEVLIYQAIYKRAQELPVLSRSGWFRGLRCVALIGVFFKLDAYRAIAIKTGGTVQLRSRYDKDFAGCFLSIAISHTALRPNCLGTYRLVSITPFPNFLR